MLSILHKNSKPSQTWRLEDDGPTRSWVQRLDRRLIKDSAFRGCRLFSEATQCDLQLRVAPPQKVRRAPHLHQPFKATFRHREGMCPCPIVHSKVSCKWDASFVQAWSCRNKNCRILLHCQPGILALECLRPYRQTTSFHVRSFACRHCLPTKAGYFRGENVGIPR